MFLNLKRSLVSTYFKRIGYYNQSVDVFILILFKGGGMIDGLYRSAVLP